MIISDILVSSIRPGPQYDVHRLDRDPEALRWIAHCRKLIRDGEKIAPIVVDQRNFIVDGHHRWRAHQLEKCSTIRAIVDRHAHLSK